MELPVIDLSADRSEVSKLIVEACQKYGFFKVINHGVCEDVIQRMEEESLEFFAKPASEKRQAGPANPYGHGYGCKNIGLNGDVGDVEYLLLHINPSLISQTSNAISNDPKKFSSTVNGYIEAVRGLACRLLDLMAEELRVPDTSVFSKLIRDADSDSLIRVNHYAPTSLLHHTKVGFGEHSDPQILTLLRSNDVDGLQISPESGVWVPVSPDPSAFCVNVGDVLQVMTNGRFVSVRHRAVSNSCKSRVSIAYFAAPALEATIAAPAELVTAQQARLYRDFTWADYKKATLSLRLGDDRLTPFRLCPRYQLPLSSPAQFLTQT